MSYLGFEMIFFTLKIVVIYYYQLINTFQINLFVVVVQSSRTGRPDYAEKILRSSEKKKKDIFGEMKPRLTCTNMMGREKYTQGSKQLPIWSIKLYLLNMGEPMVWHGHVWLLVELGHYCVLMVWLLTEVTDWMLKCTGLYSLHIFSQMLNNWLDGASYCKMIMTHGLLQKQTKNFSKHVFFFFSFGR